MPNLFNYLKNYDDVLSKGIALLDDCGLNFTEKLICSELLQSREMGLHSFSDVCKTVVKNY